MPGRCSDEWLDARGVAAYNDERGGSYVYIPGELVIDAEDAERPAVREELKRLGASTDPEPRRPAADGARRESERGSRSLRLARDRIPGLHVERVPIYDPPNSPRDDGAAPRRSPVGEDLQRRALEASGLRRFFLPPERDIPSVVRRLRTTPDGDPVRVAPNHVLSFEPFWQGGPGSTPAPRGPNAAVLQPPQPLDRDAADVTVAVLDTGIVREWRNHEWFAGRVDADADDGELLDANRDRVLDLQAGHGTFIAGLVAQVAPEARIRVHRILDSFGLATDVEVAAMIRAVDGAQVINLSLGGYTDLDQPTPTVARTIDALDPETVVVAAAGNAASDRLFWPAALKTVVAVGSHDGGRPDPARDGDGRRRRACFSNFGWWVDACADGLNADSAFVAHNGPLAGSPDADDFLAPSDPTKGFAVWSGTSFAAPVVAGAIAARAAADGSTARQAWQTLRREAGETIAGIGRVMD